MKKLILLGLSMLIMALPFQAFAIPQYDWYFDLDGYTPHTYDFADVVAFDNVNLGFLETHSWSHMLPGDFNGIKANVTDAQLWITARGVTSDISSPVLIQGLAQLNYLEGQDWRWSWRWGIVFDDETSETIVDLPTTVDDYEFWQNDPINMCVGTGQLFTEVSLERSVMMMDYDMDAIPEPATIALFGLGLAGVGILRRKMK